MVDCIEARLAVARHARELVIVWRAQNQYGILAAL